LSVLKGLHSSGGGSGIPEPPKLPEEEEEEEDDDDAKGDSTQIPDRQQPSESQSICPGIPVESPQTRPPAQQLFGGICPAGLVQRQDSPSAGRRCDVLEVVVGSCPSPSTECEQANRDMMPSETARRQATDFMGGSGCRSDTAPSRSKPLSELGREGDARGRARRPIATTMLRT